MTIVNIYYTLTIVKVKYGNTTWREKELSGLMGNILVYLGIVFICFLIAWFTKSECFGVVTFIMIIGAPIMIPVSHVWIEYSDMEKKVVEIFGEDIKKEHVENENKLIVKSKEGIYEVYYDENKKIDLIKNITKNVQDEEKQREKTREILKNL